MEAELQTSIHAPLSYLWLFLPATPWLTLLGSETKTFLLFNFCVKRWGVLLQFGFIACSHSSSAPLNLLLAFLLGMVHLLWFYQPLSPVVAACYSTNAFSTSQFYRTKTWRFLWFLLRCEQLPRTVSKWRDLQGEILKWSNLETDFKNTEVFV